LGTSPLSKREKMKQRSQNRTTFYNSDRFAIPTTEESLETLIYGYSDGIPTEALLELFEHLSKKIYCSNVNPHEKNHKVRLERKAKAVLQNSHIAINNQFIKRFIVIDMDIAVDIHSLPITPTWAVQNSGDKKAHLIYELEYPISTKNKKALNYYYAVKTALTNFLGGDLAYTDVIVKSPFSIQFDRYYNPVKYTLSTLMDAIQEGGGSVVPERRFGRNSWRAKENSIDLSKVVEGNRNASIFNIVRRYAYGLDHKDSDLFNKILNYAREINSQIAKPLPDSEIRATAKSIYKYVSAGKHLAFTDKKNRGVCTELGLIEEKMTLRERQQVGAYYTNESQREKMESKIEEAVLSLSFDREIFNLTLMDIAREMAKKTLKSAKTIWESLRKSYREYISQLLSLVEFQLFIAEEKGKSIYQIEWNGDFMGTLVERVVDKILGGKMVLSDNSPTRESTLREENIEDFPIDFTFSRESANIDSS
jgi:hypothetical protein